MTVTVRVLVKAVQVELRDTQDLQPSRAAEMLNQITALIGNCNDKLRAADLEYKRVLLACLQSQEKANRARIVAETSPEFVRYQEARHLKELAIEMARSLKAFLRSKEEEMRLAR